MRGPIDYIIVGFEGNQFDGSILKALEDATAKGTIDVLALDVISKDKDGNVMELDMSGLDNSVAVKYTRASAATKDLVTKDDVNEVGELLQNDTTAGLLVIEQLWAKPLKEALEGAHGELVAEGRIHPQAAAELSLQGGR